MSTRHQTARTYELALLLKQHEVAGDSPEQLDRLLAAEINRAHALKVELRPALRHMRHLPSELMVRCEDAVTRAQAARERRDFAGGLKGLKEAQRWLACLRELLEDAAEVEAAASEYKQLLALLGSEYLAGLPSINSVAHLLSEADAQLAAAAAADNLLAAARGRQAHFIAGLCREKLRALQAVTNGDAATARRLESLAREQSAYCARTSEFAPAPSADRQVRQAFERLSCLLADGRLTLVARLTGDIEGSWLRGGRCSPPSLATSTCGACGARPRARPPRS